MRIQRAPSLSGLDAHPLVATLVTAACSGLAGLQGGRMILLFGCRRPDEDHLYQEEMLEMAQKGVLRGVHTAYSRLPGQPKVNATTVSSPLNLRGAVGRS